MPDPAYLALVSTPGIGRARLDTLLDAFGSAGAVRLASHDELCSVPGISRAAATAIRQVPQHHGDEILRRAEAAGVTVLVPHEPGFPEKLRLIPDSPPVLFAKGHTAFLERPAVAVVGSRDHTRYGEAACRSLASQLAAHGLAVVSGMARGLDAVAHRAAIDAGGATVGVLGNGIGVVYPAANRALYETVVEVGCLLTEFPPGERPHAGSFPRRNRLISGLAAVTVVVEAGSGSGALITADCALSQGREVMAVPGPIDSPVSVGTNRLVQLGAKPVLDVADILEEFGLTAEAPRFRPPPDLTELERRILDRLDVNALPIDSICDPAIGTAADILAALTALEIRGLVQQQPGKVFARQSPAQIQTVPPRG